MAFKSRAEKNEQQKRPHVYVATPAYDGRVLTDYALSMTETALLCGALGIQITATIVGNGAFIEIARNNLARMFLETDCTHLFYIDADLRFEPRAFVSLVKDNRPICAGMYRRRQEPEDYPVKLAPNPELGGLWVEDGWVMAERVPTGFLCIRRDVVEEMAREAPIMKQPAQAGHPAQPDTPVLFKTYYNEDRCFVGEDYAFCDDYRKKYGRPIPVWPDFDFTHSGYKCNWYNFLAKKIEEEDRERLAAVAAQAEGPADDGPDEAAEDAA